MGSTLITVIVVPPFYRGGSLYAFYRVAFVAINVLKIASYQTLNYFEDRKEHVKMYKNQLRLGTKYWWR
ncbi:hypothetical protein TP70_08630 [Staphylococcus microti]|uniref:Uncharacterized protein n=1 Tax=Staphylococcus microti TaxID=569857 RepID=A0ABR5C6E9_9STAP|nr:hypothetical protein TP70_08630 [Staphylococcus microti]PNZ82537.1 hypothetical protein CD132_04390 [Staphylococcus microti]